MKLTSEMALELTELAIDICQNSELDIAESVEEVTDIFEHFAATVEESDCLIELGLDDEDFDCCDCCL